MRTQGGFTYFTPLADYPIGYHGPSCASQEGSTRQDRSLDSEPTQPLTQLDATTAVEVPGVRTVTNVRPWPEFPNQHDDVADTIPSTGPRQEVLIGENQWSAYGQERVAPFISSGLQDLKEAKSEDPADWEKWSRSPSSYVQAVQPNHMLSQTAYQQRLAGETMPSNELSSREGRADLMLKPFALPGQFDFEGAHGSMHHPIPLRRVQPPTFTLTFPRDRALMQEHSPPLSRAESGLASSGEQQAGSATLSTLPTPCSEESAEESEAEEEVEVENWRRPPRRDHAKDHFLVEKRQAGLTYRNIQILGGFTEAVSTLRGRYRTLTKRRRERVRRPKWSERDVSAL